MTFFMPLHCVKIIQIYQEKIGGEIMMQSQYLYDNMSVFMQKDQNFISRFLQKFLHKIFFSNLQHYQTFKIHSIEVLAQK